MARPSKNSFQKKSSGARVATLAALLIIIGTLAGYFIFARAPDKEVLVKKPDLKVVKPRLADPTIPQAAKSGPPAVIPDTKKENSIVPPTLPLTESANTASATGKTSRLAIIIDDMGSSLQEARSLAAVKVPLTFAIIPGLRHDDEVSAYAIANNIETIIHIPMQSKGWPARRLESNGLLVTMDSEELQERVTGFVRQFPKAVGVNNHMGSEFTEQEVKMAAVLNVLKKNNLYFIDSVTSPQSVGLNVSQGLGIRSARRNVFLDNEKDRNYIIGQLNQAVKAARKNGSAIAICHPHPATISALAAALPELAGRGVTLVHASELVR